MAKIYPIGVQSFAKLREDGYTYVDKTDFIKKLISEGNCFFLSRPRRFGKSLLLSTIEAFFRGRKELFDGLAISHYDHDWQPHPVFHLALNANKCQSSTDLEDTLNSFLHNLEREYGRNEISNSIALRFGAVIRSAYEKTGSRVVILIDEYDKPLLDSVGDTELQNSLRAILKGFYSNLKNCDPFIEFTMLTGVTKFGKLSIFSDLNNLKDISLMDEFSAICGITKDEIVKYFDSGVRYLAEKNNLTVDEAYAKLKTSYDGYHFSPESPDIYNPFSLLNALDAGRIGSYWFATGTPTFLIEMIKRDNLPLKDFNNYETDIFTLESVPADLQNPIPVLYQSGYLTIKDYDTEFETVTLGYPNREVERGFLDVLFSYYTPEKSSGFTIKNFVKDVRSGNVDGFMTRLQGLFSGYKYSQIDLGNLELHYRNVIYLVMKLMGFFTEAEMQTASGRIDLKVGTTEYLYLFEFKLNKNAQEAMDQINDRDYLLPFQADGRKIVKVGANFDDRIRSISTPWLVEQD